MAISGPVNRASSASLIPSMKDSQFNREGTTSTVESTTSNEKYKIFPKPSPYHNKKNATLYPEGSTSHRSIRSQPTGNTQEQVSSPSKSKNDKTTDKATSKQKNENKCKNKHDKKDKKKKTISKEKEKHISERSILCGVGVCGATVSDSEGEDLPVLHREHRSRSIPVYLNIYNIISRVPCNIYHSAIEACGAEFAYAGDLGVYQTQPGDGEKMKLIERRFMGSVHSTPRGILKFMTTIAASEKYDGSKYDLLTRNCNNFTEDCLKGLQLETVQPRYVNSLARHGQRLRCMLPSVVTNGGDPTR